MQGECGGEGRVWHDVSPGTGGHSLRKQVRPTPPASKISRDALFGPRGYPAMPAARPPLPCPGPIDRRQWLTVGGLSLGALVSGLEPSLAGLFAAEKAAPRRALSKDFSVILFWANGGPSHLDLFDLK